MLFKKFIIETNIISAEKAFKYRNGINILFSCNQYQVRKRFEFVELKLLKYESEF